MAKDFSELVRNGQTTLSNDEGDSPKLSAVLASCGVSPEVSGVRLQAAIDAYENAEAKKAEAEAEETAKAEAEAKAAEEKAKAEAEEKAKAEAEEKAKAEAKAKSEAKRIRILLEHHFNNLVEDLRETSSLLSRLGKEDPSDCAVLSDSVRHLNDASLNLFFVRRDTTKVFENIEDLVNEAFLHATEQLIAIRENRQADSLRCIVTLVNVALRLSTECLVDIRTVKD